MMLDGIDDKVRLKKRSNLMFFVPFTYLNNIIASQNNFCHYPSRVLFFKQAAPWLTDKSLLLN